MTKINKTALKNMKVTEIKELLQKSNIDFAENTKKDDLIEIALSELGEVNEMNNEEVKNVVVDEEMEMHKEINMMIDSCESIEELQDVANQYSADIKDNKYDSLAIAKHDLKKEIGTDYLVEDVDVQIGDSTLNIGQEVVDRIEEIVNESTSSKKRGGRGKKIIITKNGEPFGEEPTIKSCAQRFKELFELKAMPFNQIMKSTRSEGKEPWVVGEDTYVFVFENKEDILTPRQKSQKSVKQEDVESQFEEIIDEEQKEFVNAMAEELQ